MNQTQKIGALGEKIALLRLEKKGYKLLHKNYRGDGCEIDIVMEDGNTIVFVEVKTRCNMQYATGREAVGYAKQQHILRAAQCYLAEYGLHERMCRMDVVEIDMYKRTFLHIKSAFTG